MIYTPYRGKLTFSSQTPKSYQTNGKPFEKLNDLSVSTASFNLIDSPQDSQSQFQMQKIKVRSQYYSQAECQQDNSSNKSQILSLKSYKSMERIGITELQKQKVSDAAINTKSTFVRYIGNIEKAKQRFSIYKQERNQDQLNKECSQKKNQNDSYNKISLSYILKKQYLTQQQKILIQKLNNTLKQLHESEKSRNQLQNQKLYLQHEFNKIKNELKNSEEQIKWYQHYSEEKDFQAKALYWRQYFRELEESKKYNKR